MRKKAAYITGAVLVCAIVILGVSRLTGECSIEKVSRRVHEIPIVELYQQFGIAPPKFRNCMVGPSYCEEVSITALRSEYLPLGGGIATSSLIKRMSQMYPGNTQSKFQLIEVIGADREDPAYANVGSERGWKSYVTFLDVSGPIEVSNMVLANCREKHCIAELGPELNIEKRQAHFIFAFDRGRVEDLRTLGLLVMECVRRQCRLFQ